jgi:hypothetical protein
MNPFRAVLKIFVDEMTRTAGGEGSASDEPHGGSSQSEAEASPDLAAQHS